MMQRLTYLPDGDKVQHANREEAGFYDLLAGLPTEQVTAEVPVAAVANDKNDGA